MENNYYNLIRKLRDLRRNYKNLNIDEKIDVMNLEIKIEGKNINGDDCHTKSEKKSKKTKVNVARQIKQKKFDNKSFNK